MNTLAAVDALVRSRHPRVEHLRVWRTHRYCMYVCMYVYCLNLEAKSKKRLMTWCILICQKKKTDKR